MVDGILAQPSGNIWMSGAQPAADSPGLAIHIAALVGAQEQGHPRNLVCVAASSRWVQVPNLLLVAPRPGGLVHGGRHARLDETGANGINADPRTGELVRDGLGERDDGRFGG